MIYSTVVKENKRISLAEEQYVQKQRELLKHAKEKALKEGKEMLDLDKRIKH